MTSHLLGLYVENFKRIALAEVKFDPAGVVVAIMGQNEAGKSSLLDALEVLIAGRKAQHPDRPVHAGADTAKIIGTFDDITVTRQYRPDGKTQIEVKSAEGLRMASAEELLRSLYSHVALDPLAFSQLSEKEQLDVLEKRGAELGAQRLADAAAEWETLMAEVRRHMKLGTDPGSEDVRALAKGRHELRIARPLRGDRKPEQDEQDPGYDAIPFWR